MSKKKQYEILSTMVKWAWLLLIGGVILTAFIFTLVSFTRMPDTEELENPDYEQASIIYADDLSELGRFYSKNRVLLTYEELNPHLVNALIATEDERFFRHSGIDTRGTVRAIIYMSTKGGASTITQQLAKQFFTKRSRSFIPRVWQKLKEWVIAIEFEKRYTKEEIIAMYLNKFDFIYSSFGVSSAARTYFGKEQSELAVDEAAILIGMLKNPNTYNPRKYPENARARRNVVLNQMHRNGFLTSEEISLYSEKDVDLKDFNRSFHYEGPAPHFRATLTNFVRKIFEERKYRKPDGTEYNIYEDGLRFYTTINKDMQAHAEAAAWNHMKTIQSRYFELWKNRDPWTYGADENQEEIRRAAFNRAVRESERYIKMRDKALTPLINKVRKDIPEARFWESDFNRMQGEEEQPGYLNSLRKRGIVSGKQIDRYKAVMRHPLWPELKEARRGLDSQAVKVFNTKRKMRVFAYDPGGEKTVVMSPLDSIRYHQQHMQIGSVSIDPANGHVKAWVGGIGNKYFKYDHVLSNRQVGSTFKPFVYATALVNQGISPCQRVEDMQYIIPAGDPNFGLMKTWAPANSDGTFSGEPITLKDGLKYSRNSISVWLVKELGSVRLIRNMVEQMGISREKVPEAPSIVLGAAQLNVLEMTAAYATFANYGSYIDPVFVTRIEDKEGKVIYNAVPRQKRVLTEKYNDAMINFLKYASEDHKWKLKSEWGGKTGTTNDYVDGWFMGISPELVVGTWVGGEHNWIRFLSISQGAGGVMARPFYIDYMRRLEADPDISLNHNATFRVPEGDRIEFDCEKYDGLYSKDEADSELARQRGREDQFDEEF